MYNKVTSAKVPIDTNNRSNKKANMKAKRVGEFHRTRYKNKKRAVTNKRIKQDFGFTFGILGIPKEAVSDISVEELLHFL